MYDALILIEPSKRVAVLDPAEKAPELNPKTITMAGLRAVVLRPEVWLVRYISR